MKNDKYYMKPHTVVKIREDLKKTIKQISDKETP